MGAELQLLVISARYKFDLRVHFNFFPLSVYFTQFLDNRQNISTRKNVTGKIFK